MSGFLDSLKPQGVHALTDRWGWFVGLGVVLLLAGIFAFFDVYAVTLVSVMFIGAMMLVGGVVQLIHAFAVRDGWGSVIFAVLSGLLYIVGGFLIMDEPAIGSLVITLFLAFVLCMAGVIRIVMALRHREMDGWWLMLISGIFTLVVGFMLYLTLPWSGAWVLGTLIAVELVMHGLTWIRFGFVLRARRVETFAR